MNICIFVPISWKMKGQHLYSFRFFSLDLFSIYLLFCFVFVKSSNDTDIISVIHIVFVVVGFLSFSVLCRLIIAKIYLGNCGRKNPWEKKNRTTIQLLFCFILWWFFFTLISILSFGFTFPFHCSNKQKIQPRNKESFAFYFVFFIYQSCFYRWQKPLIDHMWEWMPLYIHVPRFIRINWILLKRQVSWNIGRVLPENDAMHFLDWFL